jgi:hypothetical protein
LQAEIGYADFGGACGACFHLAPPSCKRKATKEFVQIQKLCLLQNPRAVSDLETARGFMFR